MNIKDFLSALKTKNVNVTVYDRNEDIICKIDASGYAALDDTLENDRPIVKWNINGASSLSITVDDVTNNSSDTEPDTNPDDPGNP